MALLGIEIGDNSIKLLEVNKKENQSVITHWSIVDIPLDLRNKHPEREVFQSESIKKFLVHTSSKDAVVVVGGLNVVSKIIALPHLGDAEVAEAVKWQMKDEIPFKVEEGIFSYFKLGDLDKNKVNYLVVVAKEEVVLKSLQTMGLAGVKPLTIIPASEALFYTFEKEIKQEGVVCLLHMGQFLTNISFFENGLLQLSRDVPIGSDDITKAMTSILVSEEGRLELDYDEAEKIRIKYGIPVDLEKFPKLEHIPIAHLQAVIRPALERIEEEIIRTIEYFRNKVSDNAIKRIVFTGSASETPNLAQILSQSIGISCETADPFANVKIDQSIEDKEGLIKDRARLCAVVGAVSAAKSRINLIPEEYRDRWKVLLKRYLTPQYMMGALLFVLFLFYGLLYANIYFLENKKAELNKELSIIEPKIKRLDALAKSVADERGRSGVFSSLAAARIKVSHILVELGEATPNSVMLDTVSFTPTSEAIMVSGNSFLRGKTAEKNLSQFVNNLSDSPLFENVQLDNAGLGLDYSPKNFKFNVNMEIKK